MTNNFDMGTPSKSYPRSLAAQRFDRVKRSLIKPSCEPYRAMRGILTRVTFFLFQDCFPYYSTSFEKLFVPHTPTVVAEPQYYMAAMTVNYIKACKEFNFQLLLKLPVKPPLPCTHVNAQI